MSSILDKLPVVTDPIWPWSLPKFGWLALGLTGGLLLAAAAWSYFRVTGAKGRRVGVVLAIRILALLLIFLALSGTSCVRRDEMRVPSILLVGIDASESMSVVNDEMGMSRWEYLLKTLKGCRGILDKLRDEYNIQVVFFRFGDDVAEFDPDDPGAATGKRTDTAQFLRYIYEKYRGERYLRGCIILSDGADNVASTPSARDLAARFRNLPCPVVTVAFGNKATTSADRDIVVTSITTEPSTVAVKGKLTVRGNVDALGYPNQQVTVKVFIKGKDDNEAKEVASETDTLRLRKGNQVQVTCDAPAEPGEYMVTLKVWDPDGKGPLETELSKTNNHMDTFVTVAREGLSVLLVERQERFPEPQMLLTALAADKRIRVYVAWLRGKELLSPDQKGLFQFDQQPYDVVILGDVTPERLKEADPDALDKLAKRVKDKRTGLLMMGGPSTFGHGAWANTAVGNMLPVKLNRQGPLADSIRLKPTPEGLKYVLRLGENAKESLERWEKLQKPEGAALNGVYDMGDLQPNARLFAVSSIAGTPLLAGRDVGTGRTMAFACDTTHLWVRPDNGGAEAHARFWQRVVLWLAKQEDTEDNLRLRLDTRRLALGDKLGFGVQLYGKQREDIKDARYTVKIVDKDKIEVPVEVVRGLKGARDANEARGDYRPRKAGEYRVVATATGTTKDDKGKSITVTGKAMSRFIVFQDDAETTEKAANPDFLADLATAGGGQSFRPDKLEKFLKDLPRKPLPHPPPKPTRYPDWRVTKGRSPFLLAFILLFVQLLALEWFLRRRWGMV